MKLNKLIMIGLLVLISAGMFLMAGGGYDKLYNPILKGTVSGVPFTWIIVLEDTQATADVWVLGDTTYDGMYVPEQSIEIVDIKIHGDMDSGDSCCVQVWAINASDTSSETIYAGTDTLGGTTFAKVEDVTLSGTYETINRTQRWNSSAELEGLAIKYDFVAGVPNMITIAIEGKTRISDAYE